MNDNMYSHRITVMLAINKMIIGGAEQQFLELVKGMDKRRFRTIVVTVYDGGDLEPQIKALPNIEYLCLHRKGKLDFSPFFKVMRLLRTNRVDIVQPFLTPATFFTLLPAVFRRTLVKLVTERGNRRRNPGLGYSFYLRVEDFFTRYADWVIPNSRSGGDHLVSRGINPDKIKVIYNGINIDRLVPDPARTAQVRESLRLAPDGWVVGISASLTPQKDHRAFLKAAQLVLRTMPRVKFAILGDGPLREELENLSDELGVRPNVFFLGNQTEVSPYLANFDIVCLCSSEMEGCSNAILEAMALGKPVVATNVGGNGELVENGRTGILIPVQNPTALADAIMACIKQPELAKEMGRCGREMIATRFSLERMVHDYETLYEETVRAKRAKSAN
jgi:glycosyltransferase involved in cell wall biosynthesis